MTDHKFTDDDVIKALECCLEDVANCNNCPYERYCDMHENNMVRDTLALINRQKAQIESLNAVHADVTESLRLAAEANKDMQAEIEMLEKHMVFEIESAYDRGAKATIKEFSERLKSDLGRIPQYHFTRSEVEWSINTLVKERTEENK